MHAHQTAKEARMDTIVAALERATEGAFLIDRNQRITFWNRAAQEMLGYAPAEVLGRLCFDVIQGRDDHDHAWCRGNCSVTARAKTGQPVETFNTLAKTKAGDLRWINVSILALETAGEEDSLAVLHLFRDASELKRREQFARQVLHLVETMHQQQARSTTASGSPLPESLTAREMEVLQLLAQGFSTLQIIQALSISRSTTRNHIQNIYQKLEVHTRAQAVAYAFEHGLVS
jgi:PAS domain S-box-containing protein